MTAFRAKLRGLTLPGHPAIWKDRSALDVVVRPTASDASLERTLAILKMVTSASGPSATEPNPSPEGAVKQRGVEEWRELERAEMQKRVAAFRGHQQRFQSAREAYCESMLKKARG